MRQIMDQAGEGDRLHLLGPVPYRELPALYQQADAFVFPSLIESFGHPLVEAMASGIPIAASNVTALPEICNDAAVYFNPEDIHDAVEKISQILTDRSLREQLVNQGRSRASEFSWEKTAKKTLALFQNVSI
jgi:glycosyltransferase involved in cell wall biosynthesis